MPKDTHNCKQRTRVGTRPHLNKLSPTCHSRWLCLPVLPSVQWVDLRARCVESWLVRRSRLLQSNCDAAHSLSVHHTANLPQEATLDEVVAVLVVFGVSECEDIDKEVLQWTTSHTVNFFLDWLLSWLVAFFINYRLVKGKGFRISGLSETNRYDAL
jgi:hypothetical protein